MTKGKENDDIGRIQPNNNRFSFLLFYFCKDDMKLHVSWGIASLTERQKILITRINNNIFLY